MSCGFLAFKDLEKTILVFQSFDLLINWSLLNFQGTCSTIFLPLLRRFNPAEPVVEKSVIL